VVPKGKKPKVMSESESEEVMPKSKRPLVKNEYGSESEEEVMPKSKRPLVKSGSKEAAVRTAKKVRTQ
jgi:hypothetical protein